MGSGVRQIEAVTESFRQYGSLQNLRGVVPQASMSDAFRTATLAVREGRREVCGKEALARDLIYVLLTCGGALDNVVTPPHNHQTGSMRIKPPLKVNSLGTSSNSHFPNWFRCRRDESGFAPRLRL